MLFRSPISRRRTRRNPAASTAGISNCSSNTGAVKPNVLKSKPLRRGDLSITTQQHHLLSGMSGYVRPQRREFKPGTWLPRSADFNDCRPVMAETMAPSLRPVRAAPRPQRLRRRPLLSWFPGLFRHYGRATNIAAALDRKSTRLNSSH